MGPTHSADAWHQGKSLERQCLVAVREALLPELLPSVRDLDDGSYARAENSSSDY